MCILVWVLQHFWLQPAGFVVGAQDLLDNAQFSSSKCKMSESVHWLMIEGIVPLFGAGVLYLLVGACFKIAGNRDKFAWEEAADSMGWLYAALIIAIQSAARFFSAVDPSPYRGYGCAGAAVMCCILLIVAMLQRGAGSWTPPRSMKVFALALAVIILTLGYQAREEKQVDETISGPSQGTNAQTGGTEK